MASALTRTEHYVSRKDGRVYYVQVARDPLCTGIQKAKDDIRIVRDTDHRRNIEGLGGADAVLNSQLIEDFVLQIKGNVVKPQSTQ